MGRPKMNGYSLYVKELREKYPGRFKNQEQAFSAAAPLWKELTEREKEDYKRRAKTMNGNVKTADEVRVNTDGTTFKQIKEEKLKKTAMLEKMHNDIRRSFENAEFDEMIRKRFFVAHLNYHLAPPTIKDVLPAELAILEFNLENGLTRCFHRLINAGTKIFSKIQKSHIDQRVLRLIFSGTMRNGFYLPAKEHSEVTHKLFPDLIGVTKKMDLYYDIMNFLTNGNVKTRTPIVYAMPDDTALNDSLVALRGFLTHLEDFMGMSEPVRDEHLFRVYPLPTLLFHLHNDLVDKYSSDCGTISESYAHSMLTKDTYMYLSGGTFCEFHEKDENFHCSRSKVVRSAFLIFDHTLEILKIKPIIGRHLPGPGIKETMKSIEFSYISIEEYHEGLEERRRDNGEMGRFVVNENRDFPTTAHSSRRFHNNNYVDYEEEDDDDDGYVGPSGY